MQQVETVSSVDLRKKRYEQLIRLMKKWSAEDPAYDTMVMEQLRQATDLTMRCEDRDETSP